MCCEHRQTFSDFSTNIKINEIYDISKLVARSTGVYIQPNKAIVGENAFAHESGIHSDGIIKILLLMRL